MRWCVRNNGWVGTALAFSISGIVRLWNLEPAYTCTLDNTYPTQGEFPRDLWL